MTNLQFRELEKRVKRLERILASNYLYEKHSTRNAYDLNEVGGFVNDVKE